MSLYLRHDDVLACKVIKEVNVYYVYYFSHSFWNAKNLMCSFTVLFPVSEFGHIIEVRLNAKVSTSYLSVLNFFENIQI